MVDIDIDEIIRVMHEKSDGFTYYVEKNTGGIICIDESVAESVEEEYEDEDTAIEEWGADMEDDDMYHENNIFSSDDDIDEVKLIKRIRFTHQDDYEPIPSITMNEYKKIVKQFIDSLSSSRRELVSAIENSLYKMKKIEDIEEKLSKYLGDKEDWEKFYYESLHKIIKNWIDTVGLEIS